MKFLIDENVAYQMVLFLREKGHDVFSVVEKARGKEDADILMIADLQKRMVVTNDKDFGELVFNFGRKSCGVILLRTNKLAPERQRKILEKFLNNYSENFIKNKFCVLSEFKTRITGQ